MVFTMPSLSSVMQVNEGHYWPISLQKKPFPHELFSLNALNVVLPLSRTNIMSQPSLVFRLNAPLKAQQMFLHFTQSHHFFTSLLIEEENLSE